MVFWYIRKMNNLDRELERINTNLIKISLVLQAILDVITFLKIKIEEVEKQ
jgi:hypothetical protein